MATSAFKSTTKRSSIDGCGDSSSKPAHRRSSSLSRFSHPLSQAAEYTAAPKGDFVNTVRGSDAWPEISLDDLALEFFSSSSITNDEEEKGDIVERGRSRSTRRSAGGSEIGRWASETASSKRRGRSVSRHGGSDEEIKNVIPNGIGSKSKDSEASSRRKRSVSASRHANGSGKNVASNGTGKKMVNNDANPRRRRSLSVARYHISDFESDADHFRGANHNEEKKSVIINSHDLSSHMKKTSGEQLLLPLVCQKDLSGLYDGYSSHSSVLTDDESKGARCRKNGNKKTIHAVYAQKRDEYPKEDAVNSGWREAMRKEVQHAVKEIRGELEHGVDRNNLDFLSANLLQSDEANAPFPAIGENYSIELDQSQKCKQDHHAKMMLDEQHEHGKELRDLPPYSNNSAAAQKHTGARKSSNKNRTSNQLSEEAEKFLEDFLSSVEDTDFSSFDGDKSDASSTLGQAAKPRGSKYVVNDAVQNPAGSNHDSLGMDGVILPWLQWETTNETSLSGMPKGRSPITPKTLQWDTEQGITTNQEGNDYSASSHGSCCPGISNGHPAISKEDSTEKCMGSGTSPRRSIFDMSECVVLKKEEVLFELFTERNQIDSGGFLLCTHIF